MTISPRSTSLITISFFAALLAGCGGGATTGAGGGIPIAAGGGTTTGGGGTSAKPTPTPTATSSSPATTGSIAMAAPSTPPDAPGVTNVVPTPPAAGTCRTGQIYNVTIESSLSENVGFTVFEPAKMCAGQTYPLVLHAPGFGDQRTTTLGSADPSSSEGLNVGNNLSELVAANYGVISFDQRGMGGATGGKIRSMDPDFEGADYLPIMDWAQNKLSWLAFGPTLDGKDPHEPIMGSIGGSYGGMYQMMLLNIDKRHRLRAITPNITPSNLNFSLYPGGDVKTIWDGFLFGDGAALAGDGSSRGQYDPFLQMENVDAVATNNEDSFLHDFMGYHSADYFCNGATIATNGGAGTAPKLPPTSQFPMVNAMVWIGVRDTLFNFNNGYHNYSCLQRNGGGDVRLLSYQAGHNSTVEGTTSITPDPDVTLYYPAGDGNDSRCGATLNEDAAQLAWFNQYLKGQAGAASNIPSNPCISLSAGDGVTVPIVPTFTSGPAETPYDVGSMNVVTGAQVDVPTATVLYTAGAKGDVEVGIPHMQIDVSYTADGVSTGSPIVYVGLGIKHASNNATWDLIDNNVLPVRGTGYFDLDMIGGGARLLPGDQLGFLVYGLQDQYASAGNVSAPSPTVVPVTITGKVYIPDIGPTASNV